MRNSWWLLVFLIAFVQCKSPQRRTGEDDSLTPLQKEALADVKVLAGGELPSQALADGKRNPRVLEKIEELKLLIEGNGTGENRPLSHVLGEGDEKAYVGNKGSASYTYSKHEIGANPAVKAQYEKIRSSLIWKNLFKLREAEKMIRRFPPLGKDRRRDGERNFLLKCYENRDTTDFIDQIEFSSKEGLIEGFIQRDEIEYLKQNYGLSELVFSEFFDFEKFQTEVEKGSDLYLARLMESQGFQWLNDENGQMVLLYENTLIEFGGEDDDDDDDETE